MDRMDGQPLRALDAKPFADESAPGTSSPRLLPGAEGGQVCMQQVAVVEENSSAVVDQLDLDEDAWGVFVSSMK